MSAWDMVLSVRRLVWQQVNQWAPQHYNEADKADLVHDAFLHLHHYAARWRSGKGRSWPAYAKVGTKMVLKDHFATRRPQPLGDHNPICSGLPGAPRCKHCLRALRTKAEMAAGADRRLEARRHSAGLCQGCAKRPPQLGECPGCGSEFLVRYGARFCSDRCRRRQRTRRERQRARLSS